MTLSALHVTSEAAPFAKTGGLADVCSALPRALARAGVRTTVILPRYRSVDPARHALARRLEPVVVPLGARAEVVHVYEGRIPGGLGTVYLLDHPLFDRDELYGEGGKDYDDNGVRFALLSRGALEVAHRMDHWPDVLHAHDWQAGLAPYFARKGLHGRPAPATIFTVHNLAFQGLVPKALVEELGLGWDIYTADTGEFYDQLSYLKVGLAYADRITTVSPRYAREIQTPEHGAGLDGFLRAHARKLVGILNGIDTEVWNPERDPHLPVRYDAKDRSGKAACKAALQREVGLPVRAQTPLVAMITRLTEQKGLSLVAETAQELASLDVQVLVLGSGERRYQDLLAGLARRHPTKFAVRIAHDEALAHRIEAGADFFLMPSRFEPCGLNQMYSLRYGAIPIVRAVGGLDDTIVDYDERTRTGNGFKFSEFTGPALVSAVKRALAAYRHRELFEELVGRAMQADHGWGASARRYVEVYHRALGARGTGASPPSP